MRQGLIVKYWPQGQQGQTANSLLYNGSWAGSRKVNGDRIEFCFSTIPGAFSDPLNIEELKEVGSYTVFALVGQKIAVKLIYDSIRLPFYSPCDLVAVAQALSGYWVMSSTMLRDVKVRPIVHRNKACFLGVSHRSEYWFLRDVVHLIRKANPKRNSR